VNEGGWIIEQPTTHNEWKYGGLIEVTRNMSAREKHERSP
jgi:hypothetical protein